MSFVEVVRFALRGLSANKLRSALTMLGILIGVAAVILLIAVGNGSAQAVNDRIEALGTNTITVMSTSRGGSTSTALTTTVADALVDPQLAPDVAAVAPVVSAAATLTYEGSDHDVNQFVGTTPSWFASSNTPVGAGAGFPGLRTPESGGAIVTMSTIEPISASTIRVILRFITRYEGRHRQDLREGCAETWPSNPPRSGPTGPRRAFSDRSSTAAEMPI